MKELRVYLDPANLNARGEPAMFYSRRADGPYYCWFYVEQTGQWDVSRVNLSRFDLRALCAASWKRLPTTLQARIIEHYLE